MHENRDNLLEAAKKLVKFWREDVDDIDKLDSLFKDLEDEVQLVERKHTPVRDPRRVVLP